MQSLEPGDLIVTDTETAGLDGGVCDIAIVKLDRNLDIVWQLESLIDPERPISPSASGIHHITDDMVQDSPTLSEFMRMNDDPFGTDNPVICGHNVQFDVRMIGEHIPSRHIKLCTLKLAKVVWPEAENHQLQTLRYMHKLEAGPAHRAMGDVITCISMMRLVCELRGVEPIELLELTRKTLSLDTKINFGKYRGTKLKDLPHDYVHWLLTKCETLDDDTRAALQNRTVNA